MSENAPMYRYWLLTCKRHGCQQVASSLGGGEAAEREAYCARSGFDWPHAVEEIDREAYVTFVNTFGSVPGERRNPRAYPVASPEVIAAARRFAARPLTRREALERVG